MKLLTFCLFLSAYFLSFSVGGSTPNSLVSHKNGHKKGHLILVHKNGEQEYFKPRSVCECIVPMAASFLGQFLGLKNIPFVRYTKVNGVFGLVRKYYPKAINFEERRRLFDQVMTLDLLSSFDVVSFLSGSYDSHRGNFLYIENEKLVVSIDHDGPVLQFGQYGDFRFNSIGTLNIAQDVRELNLEKEQKVSEQELRNLIKSYFPKLDKETLSYHMEEPDTDGKYWVIQTKKNIWKKDVNRRRVPPHQLRIRKRIVNKIKSLKPSLLKEHLKGLSKCRKLNDYIEIFFIKRDNLISKIANDPLFSDR